MRKELLRVKDCGEELKIEYNKNVSVGQSLMIGMTVFYDSLVETFASREDKDKTYEDMKRLALEIVDKAYNDDIGDE